MLGRSIQGWFLEKTQPAGQEAALSLEPEFLTGGCIISLDHPAFGRVAFIVPQTGVADMIDVLTAQLRQASVEPGLPH